MTNKIIVRSVEEFMADYKPVYAPIYPLFLGKSQSYSEEVGKVDFKRVTTVGDIRAKHITPKDTEIRQIAVSEGSKTFKKYFLANQYTQSTIQDPRGIDEVVAQVLDEHQKQADELFLLGEGTAGNNVVNNGLYWSGDANYTLESSAEIDTDADPLIGFHSKLMENVLKADLLSGRKAIIFYGDSVKPLFNGVYASSPVPYKQVLSQVLGPKGYSFFELPSAITPSSANGWIIANLDQVKTHYTALPKLKAQGVNEEAMHSWHNFMMGSFMVDVLAQNAIIRQPITLEA
jgi:hypothetical protein